MLLILIISIVLINIFGNLLFKQIKDDVLSLKYIISSIATTILSCILVQNEQSLGNLFIALSSFIFLFVAIDIKTSVKSNIPNYINLMLLTYLALIGCFASQDIISFYVFFEASIIPMFFIILLYGGNDKILAARKFFIYTIFGSTFILVPIIYLFTISNSFIPHEILNSIGFINLDNKTKIILALSMIIGFCVKLPTFPFHTWLPLAHVQAPTGGSMVLAGVLIKLGGYGIIQFVKPIFANQMIYLQDTFIIIGLISLIYGSLVAMGQNDIKKMIAYSSIAHMSYVLCGIFAMNKIGNDGAIFQMISHGIISAGLFYAIGVLYSRVHTRDINKYGNLYEILPTYSKFFLLLVMGSVGLPGTIGFVGEAMTVFALVNISKIYTILLASGCIFGCVYMLNLTRKMLFGLTCGSNLSDLTKLTINEKILFSMLSVLTILLGIYPKLILDLITKI